MSDNSIMTQEQIEEMLRMAGQVDMPAPAVDLSLDSMFTRDEQDALGEMGNICMGTAATTMYTLLGKQVTITTPSLSMHTWETLAAEHPLPLVVVEVQYIEGIDGNNLLLLKEYDVALITDLLMGGEGNIDPDNVVLDEISLSAIREVMNQMVGSSATSLASMLGKTINISTPESKRIIISEERITEMASDDNVLLKIAFKMDIEGVLSSEIMQVLPVQFARDIANDLLNPGAAPASIPAPPLSDNIHLQQQGNIMTADMMQPAPQPAPAPTPQAAPAPQAAPTPPPPQAPPMGAEPQAPYAPYPPQYQQQPYAPYPPQYQQQPYAPQYQQMPYAPYPPPQYQQPPMQSQGAVRDASSVNVREVEYPSFGITSDPSMPGVENENLWRLLDVPMQITVELGRAKKTVKQVLDLNVGSVVVLDKLAGELVEIMVNGIQVARGEVVVIDDSYGVRITELNAARINQLTNGNS